MKPHFDSTLTTNYYQVLSLQNNNSWFSWSTCFFYQLQLHMFPIQQYQIQPTQKNGNMVTFNELMIINFIFYMNQHTGIKSLFHHDQYVWIVVSSFKFSLNQATFAQIISHTSLPLRILGVIVHRLQELSQSPNVRRHQISDVMQWVWWIVLLHTATNYWTI